VHAGATRGVVIRATGASSLAAVDALFMSIANAMGVAAESEGCTEHGKVPPLTQRARARFIDTIEPVQRRGVSPPILGPRQYRALSQIRGWVKKRDTQNRIERACC